VQGIPKSTHRLAALSCRAEETTLLKSKQFWQLEIASGRGYASKIARERRPASALPYRLRH
jgi:hypothetical protein